MYFQNRDELRGLLEQHEASDMAEGMIEHERSAIRIRPTPLDGQEPPLGASRFLGEPDMPESLEWPVNAEGVPLNFLVQINFAELAIVVDESLLPSDGHLLFFTDAEDPPWGFDPEDGPGFCVLYVPAGAVLQRQKPPEGAEFEDDDGDEDFRRLMRFESTTTYPDPAYFIETEDSFERFGAPVRGAWREGHGENDPKHHMLGHAMVLQNPMEIEVQLVTNGINTGDEFNAADEARAERLAPGAEDWIPLLQLDTDEFFMWGDMGAIYFWIRKQDLAARDFSKTWMILQCG
ncbi:MAG: DUF1963 domain-containing protein [Phycisphaerales bacterium]|nr:DUF1963 domain-containing protein [Phycisphaerales bacterium]